jgi:hypothetical protein
VRKNVLIALQKNFAMILLEAMKDE